MIGKASEHFGLSMAIAPTAVVYFLVGLLALAAAHWQSAMRRKKASSACRARAAGAIVVPRPGLQPSDVSRTRIKVMVSSRARWCGAFCFGLLAIAQCPPHAATGDDVAVAQVMAKGSDLADKDLAPAVQKLRQGPHDEALRIAQRRLSPSTPTGRPLRSSWRGC